jgi:hypothetical protein
MVRKVMSIGTVSCLVALVAAGLSIAQPQGRGAQGQGPGGQRGGRNFDPAQMQQMMEQRMQEQLGATAEEWKVLGPRVMKVMALNRQVNAGGGGMFRMGMGGRRGGAQGDQAGPGGPGGPGGRRGPLAQGEPTVVDKASEALQTTLENTAATPDEIKAKLTALRAAKEKAKTELAVAQQDLKQVLSVRQEAQLVLMGMLN